MRVGALLELNLSDGGRLSKVTISVEQLVNFVLDFGFEVKFLK